MKERIIIIFVALIAGLVITSAGFFIYQSTKNSNDIPITKTVVSTPTIANQPQSTYFVKVLEPIDESLTNKRTVVVKGSTNKENIIIVSTNLEDVQAKPSTEGNFSVSIDIDAGANTIVTRAISPTGESVQDVKTITYSTEDF